MKQQAIEKIMKEILKNAPEVNIAIYIKDIEDGLELCTDNLEIEYTEDSVFLHEQWVDDQKVEQSVPHMIVMDLISMIHSV